MNTKFAALAGVGIAGFGATCFTLSLMYHTHAHMERVRGDSYMQMPFDTRLSFNVPASWERAKHFARFDLAGQEAALNRATFALPCTNPVIPTPASTL